MPFQYTCVICGKPGSCATKTRKALYCSRTCHGAAKRAAGEARRAALPQLPPCIGCGKARTRQVAKHPGEHWCSRACWTAYRRAQGSRNCDHCGTIFISRQHARYCSVRCGMLGSGFIQPKPPVVPCETCGKPVKRSYQKNLAMGMGRFCSNTCRGVALSVESQKPEAIKQRFQLCAGITTTDPDTCQLWSGSIGADGYGRFAVNTKPTRNLMAHRVAWEFSNGPIPNGLFVRHSCHVRACVRLSHLSLGTHDDNMLDMAKSGRAFSKLTADDVRSIRQLHADGTLTTTELVERFQVSRHAIRAIIYGDKWQHIEVLESHPPRRPDSRDLSVMDAATALRFWTYVDKRNDDAACWLWTSTKQASGHGTYNWHGRNYGAHRVAYALTFGPIPPRLYICHRCNVPPCVNPAHLNAGTPAQNSQQAVQDGLTNARLTVAIVREIRDLYAAEGIRGPTLAVKFGVSQRTIYSVVNRKSWTHI